MSSIAINHDAAAIAKQRINIQFRKFLEKCIKSYEEDPRGGREEVVFIDDGTVDPLGQWFSNHIHNLQCELMEFLENHRGPTHFTVTYPFAWSKKNELEICVMWKPKNPFDCFLNQWRGDTKCDINNFCGCNRSDDDEDE